ncbi:development-specific protein LVN1.2-like [Acanthaster planci]|uniref:Development-specific protein LVN1.2-like n=1 Tax=Acanthaster planci TaxID=133434 RepID=A0A8B7ZPN4_ACAPL|nr:development-specific protein LVN1.2-like [Acanthaster planci]
MNPCSVVRLVALLAATVLVADADNYCCTAPQFVIRADQLQGIKLPSGQGLAQLNLVDIAFDFTNERLGEEIDSYSLGRLTKIKVIIDKKKNVMYTIIGQNCTKTEARGEFMQCIPKTAHFDGSSYLGDNELTLDTFSFPVDEPKVVSGNVSMSVTHGNCIFAGTLLVGEATQTEPPIPLVSSTSFVNFKRGIADPSRWFDVPSFCQQKKSTRARRSVRSVSDDHKDVMKLVSIFNTMMLPDVEPAKVLKPQKP